MMSCSNETATKSPYCLPPFLAAPIHKRAPRFAGFVAQTPFCVFGRQTNPFSHLRSIREASASVSPALGEAAALAGLSAARGCTSSAPGPERSKDSSSASRKQAPVRGSLSTVLSLLRYLFLPNEPIFHFSAPANCIGRALSPQRPQWLAVNITHVSPAHPAQQNSRVPLSWRALWTGHAPASQASRPADHIGCSQNLSVDQNSDAQLK